jgi:hypothetical protein
MEIFTDPVFATARLAALRQARAETEARRRQDERTTALAAANEVRAQAKVQAESALFVAAQRPIWTGCILKAEGAAAGTTVDIRA